MLPLIAQAQDDDNTFPGNLFPRKAPSSLSVGLFGGSSMNRYDIDVAYAVDMQYSEKSGYTMGLSAAYHPTGWFSLQADFVVVQKNWRLDRTNRYVSFVYTEATNNYLSLPVTVNISLGRTFRVNGFFGGYVGYWLSGHRSGMSYGIIESGDNTRFDDDYEFSDVRDNRFDAGLTYGVGLRCTIVKKIELSGELRWYYGLTDLQKNYMTNLNPRYYTTRALQFGVGYWL